jgi:hypothetical protein
MAAIDARHWAALMGLDLKRSLIQPVEASPDGGALHIGDGGETRTVSLRVEEHQPDPLGPRFIDELHGDSVVRHAVPGPTRSAWTEQVLRELEGMVCAEPFPVDPVPPIAEGDDWVAWMTRNHILHDPRAGDDKLRASFADRIYSDQRADGSWFGLPRTAHAILRLLAIGESATDRRIQRAANWLLNLPEPAPRPGMWMLTQDYLEEWVARRQPEVDRDFGPGDYQWTGPDEAVNYYCWRFPAAEQDQFRGQDMQQAVPTCARHHPPACEPRMTHVSAVVAEVLLRCGHADHPRLRRYVNTVFHLGGEWGYWCGCGALGLYDSDIPPSECEPDFNVRRFAGDGQVDLSPWRWVATAADSALLANKSALPEHGTHLEPFCWYCIPGEDRTFALIGTGWQNGDCWAKTNRALIAHPSCTGSLAAHLATYQAGRYQTALGEWNQGFPAGMLAFLSLYTVPAARSLVARTVPWLRKHQGGDGLWHHERLPRKDWGKPAIPPGPRLATYHIVAALNTFGLMDRLRP